MKTVAIISEYNPFHTGHKHQFSKIKEEFGPDTAIIAIMSGNYTQRGEIAIMDKHLRAECAIRSGASLVLELPFPFSMTSAELFARAGISIATSLGVVDHLSFGSESGDIEELSAVAKNMQSESYQNTLKELLSTEDGQSLGYPAACEIAYNRAFSADLKPGFFAQNNTLALEYIKAITNLGSNIIPHTIKRYGADYREENITENEHQSATAIRKLFESDVDSALKYIPKESANAVLRAYNLGEFPCDAEKLSSAVISHFRLNSATDTDVHDVGGGLYNRLLSAAKEANSISALIQSAGTKKFTTARIRRAIWYSFFGVTSSEAMELPLYTRVLAMDDIGQAILKKIKKKSSIPVITKPSNTKLLSPDALRQKELSDRADFIFELTRKRPGLAGDTLRKTPFIKKCDNLT